MTRSYPKLLPKINELQEAVSEYTEITGNYATVLALGTENLYYNIAIYSTYNQDIVLRFGSSTLTVLANTTRAFDNFPHNGNVEYKHNGVAPGSGTLQIVSF